MIANDQSEFSLRSIQRNSFDNEINNHSVVSDFLKFVGVQTSEFSMAELMVTH